jgi:hypothetical protein
VSCDVGCVVASGGGLIRAFGCFFLVTKIGWAVFIR